MKRFRLTNFAFLLLFLILPLQSFTIKSEEVFAMVSGELKAFNEQGEQIRTIRIKVTEEESGKVQLRTYSPQGEKGKYYMLLSPNKKYQFEVSPEGYLPYKINLEIPENTCRYELGYNLKFKAIKLLGKVVGQNASLKEMYKHLKLGTDLSPTELQIIQDDFMLDLVDYVMQSGNSQDLKQLEKFSGAKLQQALKNKEIIQQGGEEEKDPVFDTMFDNLDMLFEDDKSGVEDLTEVTDKITDVEVVNNVSNAQVKGSTTQLFDKFDRFQDFKDHIESIFIEDKLKKNNWNVSKTSEVLDIQRSHLYNKIDKYNLKRE